MRKMLDATPKQLDIYDRIAQKWAEQRDREKRLVVQRRTMRRVK